MIKEATSRINETSITPPLCIDLRASSLISQQAPNNTLEQAMKKNFHWLVFALVAIAFWRTSDNLLFDYKTIGTQVAQSSFRDLQKDGWEVYSRTSAGSMLPLLHLKRCKLYRLFD